jgi:Secretion system C-terminal sorting domain
MKQYLLVFASLVICKLSAQVDNTMYGLYQTINPPSFHLASIDPSTGQITPIGDAALSSVVNATGSALNPYSQTFSFQDEDSWLSVDLQTGEVINDVMVTLPNVNGYFDNFRFNASDSSMYGLFRQLSYDSITGFPSADIRLATCDLSTGNVSLISEVSIAESFTMTGSTIDPYLMVYYFETEGKFTGIDLYNGQIYSEPTITLEGAGSSFDNFAYSCVDTAVYGLIMQNGVKALGKINPQTGVVTALPTILNFENYILNSGGAIDPVSLTYYFQTIDSVGVKIVGLSLIDGSVTSESYLSANGDGEAGYFIMYRIQSDCYRANRARFNVVTKNNEIKNLQIKLYPNPAQEVLHLTADMPLNEVEIIDAFGRTVKRFSPKSSDLQIPLESLNNGMYYLKVSAENGYFSKRFIKN